MPAERCFSVTVLGAAAFAGALLCCLPTALPADLAAGFAGAGFDAAGFEAVRDFVPALALAGAGGGGALFRFPGSLGLVAFLAMSLCSFGIWICSGRLLSSPPPVKMRANGALPRAVDGPAVVSRLRSGPGGTPGAGAGRGTTRGSRP